MINAIFNSASKVVHFPSLASFCGEFLPLTPFLFVLVCKTSMRQSLVEPTDLNQLNYCCCLQTSNNSVAVSEHTGNNFATIRTTSIVTKQQKEHMQEEMHEQMSGYKRMRREHHHALLKLEDKCKMEMETHKQVLDKEYETLLTQFSKELEKLQLKHVTLLERKVRICVFFIFYLHSVHIA